VERTVAELGGIDILVNDAGVFTPGSIDGFKLDTDMNPAEGEFTEMLKRLMALPRYGTVEEIAGMVAYLASPEAGYITGASLMIDGGFSA
jgi:3-oxoacyl-[acyl-carrier protein] reductase